MVRNCWGDGGWSDVGRAVPRVQLKGGLLGGMGIVRSVGGVSVPGGSAVVGRSRRHVSVVLRSQWVDARGQDLAAGQLA